MSISAILIFTACDSNSSQSINHTTISKQTQIDFNNTELNTSEGIKSTINKLIKSTLLGKQQLKNYISTIVPKYGKEFFVSTMGKDTNPGTLSKPFATLEKARNGIRAYKKINGIPNGGIVVWIRQGTYSLTKSFTLTSKDSGKKDKPIVYSSYNNEIVHLVGGIKLDSNWFKPVTANDPQWNRLDTNARNHIFILDFKAHGIKDLGIFEKFRYASISPLEVFEDEKALTLARWPDKGETTYLPSLEDKTIHIYGHLKPDVAGTYIKEKSNLPIYKREGRANRKQYYISRIEGTGENRRSWIISRRDKIPLWSYSGGGYNLPKEFNRRHLGARGIASLIKADDKQFGFAFIAEGLTPTSFKYASDKPSHWKVTDDMWVNGMLHYGWANRQVEIKNIDVKNKIINLRKSTTYGIQKGFSKKAYFVYNVLEELTTPGEYYIDRKSKRLYIWPLKNIENSRFIASMNKQSLMHLNHASWIELNGLTVEMGRERIIHIDGGEHNLIKDSKIRFSGESLVYITGKNNGITYCELTGSGNEAIYLSGGDRSSLAPANNFVTNNNIYKNNRWNWTSRGAVKIKGVGNIVEHNDIHDFMHQVIMFSGNNHRIQYNHIYNAITYGEDAGVIYSGRDWGWQGNKINYNFIHDIKNNYGGGALNIIYLDDSLSGNEVIGNVLYKLDGNAIFINGGRNNTIKNNVFYDVATAFVGTNYGAKYINNKTGDFFNLLEKLKKDNVNFKTEPWSSAYPWLAAMPNNWNALKNSKWLYPIGNSFYDNIGSNYLRWFRGPMKDNYELYTHFDKKPIKADSKKFLPIPFSKIGIQIRNR